MTAADVAEEGLRRFASQARQRGLVDYVSVLVQDVAAYEFLTSAFEVIVSTTAFKPNRSGKLSHHIAENCDTAD